jgi:Prenyltransferase and squalene oxidase repeat
VTWQLASLLVLGLGLAAGFAWYERDKPPARVLALVATLAALAVVGRLAFAAFPNVKPTTDIVLFAGYALGAVPGFVVGAIAALVSNIFLSQGPWTPWQMAAWGGVGVGGALLARALRGREPNRFLLAAVCGVAGLAFGAWMDLYQLTLAAHQDLDTYLAISATSLPYNIAHAVGNVVFSLLIGPVFIRALRRYKRRLEVRWLVPAAATVVLLAVLAAPAAASPASRAESWLVKAQNSDGGFGAAPGQASSRLYSGWTALGLAAAGRNSRDVKRHRGRSLAAYEQRSQRSVSDIGEVERTVLVATAAGLSPRDFAGKDLIAVIQRRRRGDGSIAGYVSYTTFGVLALRSAHVSPGKATVAWLVGSGNADGGFGVARTSASDSDMTGAAVQALAVVGRRKAAVTQRAVAWLRANQNDDGGFGQFRGRSSNAQSTAYAVQGLVAAGAGGATLSRALGYLRGLQRGDGSVRYSSTSSQTPVWVTAQALMALERKPLPIAAVGRAERRRSHHAAAKAAPAKPGAAQHHKAPKTPAPAPQEAGPVPAKHPDGAPPPSGASSLRIDRANGSNEGGSGPSGWLVALAVAGALAVLVLLRRRILPRRWRRGTAPS